MKFIKTYKYPVIISLSVIAVFFIFQNGTCTSTSSKTDTSAQTAGGSTTPTVTPTTGLYINPSPGYVTASQTLQFYAYNGRAPYVFSIVSGQGNGSINSSTGLLTAPSYATTMTVQVRDAAGATSTASVTVDAGTTVTDPALVLQCKSQVSYALTVHQSVTLNSGCQSALASVCSADEWSKYATPNSDGTFQFNGTRLGVGGSKTTSDCTRSKGLVDISTVADHPARACGVTFTPALCKFNLQSPAANQASPQDGTACNKFIDNGTNVQATDGSVNPALVDGVISQHPLSSCCPAGWTSDLLVNGYTYRYSQQGINDWLGDSGSHTSECTIPYKYWGEDHDGWITYSDAASTGRQGGDQPFGIATLTGNQTGTCRFVDQNNPSGSVDCTQYYQRSWCAYHYGYRGGSLWHMAIAPVQVIGCVGQ